MSKKINLSGKCIALTNLWLSNFQLFNNNFSLLKKNLILIYLIKNFLFKKKINFNFFINLWIKFIVANNNFFLLISLFKIKNFSKSILIFFLPLIKFLQNNFFLPVTVKIFTVKNFFFSNFFLDDLIYFLSLYKKFSPKKIFNYIFLFLKTNFDTFLVKSSCKGIHKKKLIGFKLQLKGRFEVTKNSMAKKNIVKYGKLNSTTLSSYSTLYEHNFFSKLGLSNFKIWFFYKLNN